MVGIMLVIIGFFYKSVVIALTERERQDFQTIVGKTATQVDSIFYNMDKTALQIAANPDIVKEFQKIPKSKEKNYFIEEPSAQHRIKLILESYNFKHDGHSRICLYNNYSDFVCTTNINTTLEGIQIFFENETFRKIKNHFSLGIEYSMHLAPQRDLLNISSLPGPECFSIIREIKDYSSNSQKCGYVEVQERKDKIESIFTDLGEDNYAIMLDHDFNIILGEENLENFNFEMKDIKSAVSRLDNEEVKRYSGYFITREMLTNAPYSIMVIRTAQAFIKPLNDFNTLLIIGTILMLTVVILTERILIRKLSKPLTDLNTSIKKISLNHLYVDLLDDGSDDELSQLNHAFNKMLRHLKDSMNKQVIAKTNELRSHWFALQSQMNPHFMHNIMAIISMEAQIDGNTKIQDMCSNLCNMFTFTSNMGDGYCSLQSEISNTENYMALMKARYEELFEYTITLDKDTENIRIPKLIVQPICENCFQHAFKKVEPVWKIDIQSYRQNDKWFIKISDNGGGFPLEFLEEFDKMKKEVSLDNIKEKLEQIFIGGLTIPNIYLRLKICYNDVFVCDLYNEKDGAVVLLGGMIVDKSVSC